MVGFRGGGSACLGGVRRVVGEFGFLGCEDESKEEGGRSGGRKREERGRERERTRTNWVVSSLLEEEEV